mmetsp:Transcript_4001/g.9570  ORF Transcript_4001/g.9570 Transcript_4001/m.9570 type:complete len:246 (-) Transcript_4001:107-844(-)
MRSAKVVMLRVSRLCCRAPAENLGHLPRSAYGPAVPEELLSRLAHSDNTRTSWLPSWLQFPGSAGNTEKGGDSVLKPMDLETYARNLRRVRMAGSLGGRLVGGSRGSRETFARMRLYEDIINAMTPEQRRDPSRLDAAAKARVAAAAGCAAPQVDECLDEFDIMNRLYAKLSARRAAGEPMPRSAQEIISLIGEIGRPGGAADSRGKAGGGPTEGKPCPLEGKSPRRNDMCPLTQKKYKRCCGAA